MRLQNDFPRMQLDSKRETGMSARRLIASALDELGERDRLSYDERSGWDDPYPLSFAEDRLGSLRRDQWWTKRLLSGILIAAGLLAAFGTWLGWSTFLGILIPLLLIPQIPTISTLVRNGRARQLYELLVQIEESGDVESKPAAATVL